MTEKPYCWSRMRGLKCPHGLARTGDEEQCGKCRDKAMIAELHKFNLRQFFKQPKVKP